MVVAAVAAGGGGSLFAEKFRRRFKIFARPMLWPLRPAMCAPKWICESVRRVCAALLLCCVASSRNFSLFFSRTPFCRTLGRLCLYPLSDAPFANALPRHFARKGYQLRCVPRSRAPCSFLLPLTAIILLCTRPLPISYARICC